MEPKDRLGDDLQEVDGRIEAQDVADLVGENVPPMFVVLDPGKPVRQVDIAAQKAPNEGLPDSSP